MGDSNKKEGKNTPDYQEDGSFLPEKWIGGKHRSVNIFLRPPRPRLLAENAPCWMTLFAQMVTPSFLLAVAVLVLIILGRPIPSITVPGFNVAPAAPEIMAAPVRNHETCRPK